MRTKHEPNETFVERLESQIAGEVRRRTRLAEQPRWPMQSGLRLAAAAVALALVSMGVGGAVVAAAYQAQTNQQRDLLTARYVLSLEAAKSRLELLTGELQTTQGRVAAGMASNDELLEARVKVALAGVSVKWMQSFVDEVRLTGREPLDGLSSPLVSGRDFVTERLNSTAEGTKVSLDVEMARMRDAQTKVEIGVADRYTVAVAQTQLVDVQVQFETLQRRLAIRQKFVKGEIDAIQTDLRDLEAGAEGRLKALKPKIELAQQQVDLAAKRVKVGAAQNVELAEAKLRLQQLQADLAKVELDLAIVRKRLGGG